jgi:MFS family permease
VDRNILRGWVIRGFGCFLWFSYALGLALLGVERGNPGRYAAVGLTAYGVGSVLASLLLVPKAARLPALPAAAVGWVVMGCSWVLIGMAPSIAMVAVASTVGAAAVVLGNACISQLIVASTAGPERRSALAGQAVVVGAASALGSLVGGPVLAWAHAQPTLIVAGVALVVVTSIVLLHERVGSVGPATRRATPEDAEPDERRLPCLAGTRSSG